MKTIKRNTNTSIFLLILVSIFIAGPAFAQPKGQQGPPPIPTDEQITEMVADLSKELSLSETQEKQVSDIYFNHFEEVKVKREKAQNSRGGDRKEMEQFKRDFENDVKAVLNSEQQKQFDAYLKERQKNQQGKGRPQR